MKHKQYEEALQYATLAVQVSATTGETCVHFNHCTWFEVNYFKYNLKVFESLWKDVMEV